MPNRATDWLSQATRDLEHAEESYQAERYEWACFAAHQAAEKAVKALYYSFGREAWGHDVAGLLKDLLDARAPADLIEKGKFLDNFYIPTRYPDGHATGAPYEHYGPLQGEPGIRYAHEILEFARLHMAQR